MNLLKDMLIYPLSLFTLWLYSLGFWSLVCKREEEKREGRKEVEKEKIFGDFVLVKKKNCFILIVPFRKRVSE